MRIRMSWNRLCFPILFLLFQSASGDARVGTSVFTMMGGRITAAAVLCFSARIPTA